MRYPPNRVCVTGGLGFIGAHLCRALAGRGYEVVCVDRARSGRHSTVAEELRTVPGVQVVMADVTHAPLEPVLEGAAAVVHLVALPGVRAQHPPAELWRHNVYSTARVARALAADARLLLVSTSSVYGNAELLPTPESSTPGPLNSYGLSKLAAEGVALSERRAADVVVCRLFTVFGPGQRPDMAFSRWMAAMLGDRPVTWCAPPEARREFTYVDDAVCGLIAALERGRAGELYNLPGCGSTPVREALREIELLLGRRARLRFRPAASEALVTAACGAKSARELGHVAQVGLREGLERQLRSLFGEGEQLQRSAAPELARAG